MILQKSLYKKFIMVMKYSILPFINNKIITVNIYMEYPDESLSTTYYIHGYFYF